MSIIADLLRVSTPLTLFVESDLAWARAHVLDAARASGAARRILEYNATEGWSGSEDLMHASGLPPIVSLKSGETDPVPYLAPLTAWLRGLSTKTGFEPEDSPFHSGVLILNDLYRHMHSPALVRQMLDLASLLPYHVASAVIIAPEPLPVGHPALSALVQVRVDGADRHRDLAAAFVDQMGLAGVDPAEIARALDSFPVARAEAVLRLVALRLVEAQDAGRESPEILPLLHEIGARLAAG